MAEKPRPSGEAFLCISSFPVTSGICLPNVVSFSAYAFGRSNDQFMTTSKKAKNKKLPAYDHLKIERKWQKYWAAKKLNVAKENAKKKKFYGLIEFPYPSGDGLHVGHIRSNTAMDIIVRKRRAEGFEALYPIGWDAFGLPTENYAIRTGIHPEVVTKKNTTKFREQLKSLGFSFDWSREINTTDPEYYKWTQWIFLKFLEKGLAYKKKMSINWCPKDKTGLANEEVIDGRCERCGTEVEKREKEQWLLAITKYADRLDRDLDPKKILIGTRNPAKVKMIKHCLANVRGIELVSLDDIPPVDDSALVEGDDFKENAKLKSEFYFKKTGLPTISTDHILWIEKWPENKGFMIHIRKHASPNGGRATDEEAVTFLQKFLKTVGGKSRANFHYAISYTDQAGSLVVDEVPHHYILQEEQSKSFWPGYPVEALLKDTETGVFKSEQPDEVRYAKIAKVIEEKFAPRMLAGHTPVDYLEKIKIQQKNWIGRSEGAQIRFTIQDSRFKKKIAEVEVFTTRADTLFGATYLVLAPEYPLLKDSKLGITNPDEIAEYIKTTKGKTEMERTAEGKEKTGVELEGIKAINPANGAEIPIWIADYVLADYGTGAIMAVPAHDERDFAFAKKFDLPIKRVVEPKFIASSDSDSAVKPGLEFVKRNAICAIVRNPKNDKYLCISWKKVRMHGLVTGGVEEGEDVVSAALREIHEETGYKNVRLVKNPSFAIHSLFYHRIKEQNRWARFQYLFLELENEERDPLSEKEDSLHEVVWKTKNELKDFFSVIEGKFITNFIENQDYIYTGEGVLNNSGAFDWLDSETARKKITESVGGKIVTTYKLRDWIFSRQRYWGEPIPVIHCPKCFAKAHGTNCVIVHGCPGSEEKAKKLTYNKHWMQWTKKELAKLEIPVEIPLMPEPWQASYERWKQNFEKLSINEESILIGHSCGTAFLVRWLGETKKKVAGLILVAPWKMPTFKGEPTKEDFYDFEIDAGIRDRVKSIFIFTSNNDYEEGKKGAQMYQSALSGQLISLDGRGHYTKTDMGTEAFPELVTAITSFISSPVPVPEKDLPVKLPKVKNYKPTDNGESPLAAISKWVNVKCPKCGGPARRETDTMPNWAGSSWYYLRYIDPKNKKAFADPKKLAYWSGISPKLQATGYKLPAGLVDWYNGGMEHTTLHLLYSRFWHKFLFDLGLVPTSEPYVKRTSHGIVLAEGGVKMSKSKPETIINPEEIVKTFGADTLRIYEMFMGPFDQQIAWSKDGILGPRRFLEKVWKIGGRIMNYELGITAKDKKQKGSPVAQNSQLDALLNQTVKKVGEDIEAMRFNTAVSALMVASNEMEKAETISKIQYGIFLRLLAPFAPHIAEELWSSMGNKKSITLEPWPEVDTTVVDSTPKKFIIQVNGKVRAVFETGEDLSEEQFKEKALVLSEIKKWTDGKPIKKTICILKNRLLNVVV